MATREAFFAPVSRIMVSACLSAQSIIPPPMASAMPSGTMAHSSMRAMRPYSRRPSCIRLPKRSVSPARMEATTMPVSHGASSSAISRLVSPEAASAVPERSRMGESASYIHAASKRAAMSAACTE